MENNLIHFANKTDECDLGINLQELKVIDAYLKTLEWTISNMLEVCSFQLFSAQFYVETENTKRQIRALRQEYAQQIKFNY